MLLPLNHSQQSTITRLVRLHTKVPTPTLVLLLQCNTQLKAQKQQQSTILTTEGTNSNTSATTTESTNSQQVLLRYSTNATTTAAPTPTLSLLKLPTLVPRRTPIKMAMLRIIDSHPVTDINKEPYKRKGSQMVLLERKKLKAQFPNTSENMECLTVSWISV
nr:ASN_HP1_G0006310.mRNA.1.CDS.1 [Saccharomyces cerevisiae]